MREASAHRPVAITRSTQRSYALAADCVIFPNVPEGCEKHMGDFTECRDILLVQSAIFALECAQER